MHTKLGTCLFIDNFLNAGLQNNVKLVAVELLAFFLLFLCCVVFRPGDHLEA